MLHKWTPDEEECRLEIDAWALEAALVKGVDAYLEAIELTGDERIERFLAERPSWQHDYERRAAAGTLRLWTAELRAKRAKRAAQRQAFFERNSKAVPVRFPGFPPRNAEPESVAPIIEHEPPALDPPTIEHELPASASSEEEARHKRIKDALAELLKNGRTVTYKQLADQVRAYCGVQAEARGYSTKVIERIARDIEKDKQDK